MALAGDHVVVKMDDSGGTLRTFADGDIMSVDLGQAYQQHDVTGFGDAAKHAINGQMQTPVTLRGYVTTTPSTGTHPVINGAFQAGATVTLRVAVGDNTTPTSGDPEYSGEFVVTSYRPTLATGSAVTFEAMLVPATGAAPAWGTLA
jgi:hypothetical protein